MPMRDGAQKKSMSKSKKTPRVCYNIPEDGEDRHKSGVNALCLDADNSRLFTAGRDGVIRAWTNLDERHPSLQGSMRYHTQWVNDLVLLNDQNTVLSCSSDKSIIVWSAETLMSRASLCRHSDYVQALAHSPFTDHVASAGLDASIFVWDVEAQMASSELIPLAECKSSDFSIYSLDMSYDGNTLVSGSTEKCLRVWDARTGEKILKLRGHTENVKTVRMNRDGTLCISGSSDGTVKLWDVGMRKCVATFAQHSDSVWAVATNEDFTQAYTACRAGSVFVTDLEARKSVLLCQEDEAVLSVQPTAAADTLWVSTFSGHVRSWGLNSDLIKANWLDTEDVVSDAEYEPKKQLVGGGREVAPAPSTINGAPVDPVLRSEEWKGHIESTAGIVRYEILNDRRHVLTQDRAGRVCRWNITTAAMVQDYGERNFDEVFDACKQVVSVPSWFSVDTTSGGLTIRLDFPHCFSADQYAGDCEVTSYESEVKVNLGMQVLRALFLPWKQAYRERQRAERAAMRQRRKEGREEYEDDMDLEEGEEADEEDEEADEGEEEKPLAFEVDPRTEVVIYDEPKGTVTFRTSVRHMDKAPEYALPHWVMDYVFANQLPARKNIKFMFDVQPYDFDEMDELPEVKLNANKVLRLHKVIAYVVDRLELDLEAISENKGLSRTLAPEEYLEMVCNEKVLTDVNMTLLTIRDHIWRGRDGEMVLEYRLREEFRQ